MKLCECGCGKETKRSIIYPHNHNRFIKGHNTRSLDLGKKPKDRTTRKCGCGCGQLTSPGKYFIRGHYIGYWHREFKRKDPFGYHQYQVQQGIYAMQNMTEERIERLRSMASDATYAMHKKYPNKGKESAENLRRWRKENPELARQEMEKARKKGMETIRKNLSYEWGGVYFDSRRERDCAQLLLTKPIEGVNCHIEIGRKEIDFLPLATDKDLHGFFVEFHPIVSHDAKGRTIEQYQSERQKIIEDSEYAGIPLVVITKLKELRD